MILQRLAEHYDRIAASGDEEAQLAPPGFSLQKISFCVVLELDGRLNSLQSLQQQDGKRLVARSMIVPGQGKPPGQGINPCFLWDSASYMLGWSPDPAPDKTARAVSAFEAFRSEHLELENRIAHPSFTAVCLFLRSWSPEQTLDHAAQLSEIATNFGVFRVAGQMQYVHELIRATVETEERLGASAPGETRAICLVSGAMDEIARLHEPKIKGVAGAQSSGALLVSFNASAYESYSKSQSYNAPVGAATAFKYTNALNYLLNRRDRRVSLGDSTVVFWADHPNVLEDALSGMFSDPLPEETSVIEEDQERVRQAKLLLTQLRDGTGTTEIAPDDQPTKFFLLGLSPNASRLSVRLWVEADAAELRKLLAWHLRDVALADGREDRLLTLRRIVAATGRAEHDPKGRLKGFDTKANSPQLAGDLARSVLTGAAYPQSLLATMLRRIHSDGEVAYARVAAIKACLVRNSRLRGNHLEVTVKLNPAEANAGYNCGRLFALLEKVQTDSAGGELNSTIKDRYFSSASTTPALVFPRLFRLSQHHLAKLETGHKIAYDRRIGEVMGLLDQFPRQLALEDQGRFVIGYFHQRQDLYTSKKDKEEGANA
jgi:CRISPR-associated protein Csd1